LVGQGVTQFATVPLSYYTSDQPVNEAIDLAGLFTDTKLMQSSTQAFLPILDKLYNTNYNVKTLGIAAGSAQILFCRAPLNHLKDVKGRVIRTITRSQAELVQALGGKSQSINMQDVAKAFKDKTIDCAIASAMTAYQSSWDQVATHIFALPLGWNQELHVVNAASWDKFDPSLKVFLSAQIRKLLESLSVFSNEQHKLAMSCLLVEKPCSVPVKKKMTLVMPKKQDFDLAKSLFKQSVLPRWAKRCNASCISDFNATIGRANGIFAKK
jgi:TRAP-type C4-dicarboxylate transport system substrate-binding protein